MVEGMTVGDLREALEGYYDGYASVLFKLDPESEGDIGHDELLVRCIDFKRKSGADSVFQCRVSRS